MILDIAKYSEIKRKRKNHVEEFYLQFVKIILLFLFEKLEKIRDKLMFCTGQKADRNNVCQIMKE